MKKLQTLIAFFCVVMLLTGCAGGNPFQKDSESASVGTETADGSGISETEPDASESESETESEKEPVVTEIKVTAVGDCSLGILQTYSEKAEYAYHWYFDNKGSDYFFEGVRDYFENDDFTLINLECVLSDATERVEKTWNIKGRPEFVSIMTGSSVEACSHGNNHCMDYGPQSLQDTHDVLDQAGVLYAYNDHTAIYTTKGIKIGIVSADLLSETAEQEAYIENGIKSLREQGADLVIASCHWGIETHHYPTKYQTNMGHKCIDWGADLVIGNHSHVLQGIEYYNGKFICYSLGNFTFGGNRNPKDKDTMIYQQTFTFVDGVLQPKVDAQIIPCTVSSKTNINDYQPTVAGEEKKAEIIKNMNAYSAKYSKLSFDGEGKILVETEEAETETEAETESGTGPGAGAGTGAENGSETGTEAKAAGSETKAIAGTDTKAAAEEQ